MTYQEYSLKLKYLFLGKYLALTKYASFDNEEDKLEFKELLEYIDSEIVNLISEALKEDWFTAHNFDMIDQRLGLEEELNS